MQKCSQEAIVENSVKLDVQYQMCLRGPGRLNTRSDVWMSDVGPLAIFERLLHKVVGPKFRSEQEVKSGGSESRNFF